MSDATFDLNIQGLDKLLKALKTKPPVCKVGILGDSARAGGKSTNAEVGAAHEYGAPARGLPQRSFLRVPIGELLEKRLESNGLLDKDVLANVIKQGSVAPWLEQVAVTAETISKDAFDSQGFGKWPAWKSPQYENNTGMVLVDTTQLRDSVTHEVKT